MMATIEETIRNFFKDKNQVISVDLFGSYAEGRQTKFSDIDVAILCEYGKIPSPFEIMEWRDDLETLVHKEVDLICLNDASPILGMQVAKHRKNLLINNSRKYADYQMVLFTDYAELKEMRAPMEMNILKRKFS